MNCWIWGSPATLNFVFPEPAKGDDALLSIGVPADWLADVRTAKVCYRTSQQIRRAADKLLPTVFRDTDGLEDERRGIISVFDGPAPEVKAFADVTAKAASVRQTVETWLGEGIAPKEIGLFVRTSRLVTRARAAIAGLTGEGEINTAPMSLARGLEFRAVVVMACDEGILPLDARVAEAADEAELDDIYETERRLLYVAQVQRFTIKSDETTR